MAMRKVRTAQLVAVVPRRSRHPAGAVTVFPGFGEIRRDRPTSDLFHSIVHELGQPLTALRGQLQLAQRHSEDPSRRAAAIDRAIAQTDRMSRLIDDLLDASALASGGMSLQVAAVDLVAAVEEGVARHDHGRVKRIRFVWPHGVVLVRADPGRLAQILDNLLSNAVKYGGPDQPIEVSLVLAGGEAQVRVSDRGPGIPADECALLFTPFYRSSRTRHLPGTGLGLHVSRQLAERQDGRLWLDASSGVGSVFAFALPLG